MKSELPNISILIPVLNEQNYIESCLNSIINGDYPIEKIEILVIDGGSVDATKEIVLALTGGHVNICLLDNPRKVVPAALNIGVRESAHDILVWLGAHAEYDKHYLKKSVLTLLHTQAASVGGVLRAKGRGRFGQALAFATSTKLGIGNAKYRYATQQQSVDTVFGGCWRKSSILEIGGFNEGWVRNQDFELNYRLRKNVGDIILNPEIKVSYFVREKPNLLIKQYFQYGFWRFKTFQRYPGSLGLRQLMPLCLVLGLIISLLLVLYAPVLSLVLPFIYLLTVVSVSLYVVMKVGKWRHLSWLLVIYPMLHISWGLGFIWSSLLHLINKTFLVFKS